MGQQVEASEALRQVQVTVLGCEERATDMTASESYIALTLLLIAMYVFWLSIFVKLCDIRGELKKLNSKDVKKEPRQNDGVSST